MMTPSEIHKWVNIYRVFAVCLTLCVIFIEELKTTAIELQELIQSKVGTTKFSTVYSRIRRGVLEVRRERKVAKVLQTATNPEAAAKRKIQRNVIKKDSRKRKESGFL